MADQDGGYFDEPDLGNASSGEDVVAAPQGFGSSLGGSFVAILIGLALVPLACIGLFWNEGHAVHVERALAETQKTVRTIPTDRRDPSLDGRPVHVAGTVTSAGGVRDPQLGIGRAGLVLARKVEMYQWRESQTGSGQDRKYVYRQEWSDSAHDSSHFHTPSGHQNPSFPNVRSRSFAAADARIDAIPVGTAVQDLGADQDMPVDEAGAAAVAKGMGRTARVDGGAYYVGREPETPKVGDLKISYRWREAGPASFIGSQEASGLRPFRATNGEEILLAAPGIRSADQLVAKGQDDNKLLTMILRVVGLVVLLIGFLLLFAPVNLLANYVPILGSLVSGATFLVALAATLVVGPSVIALAWLAYRPLLALAIVAVSLLAGFGLVRLRRRKQAPAYAPA